MNISTEIDKKKIPIRMKITPFCNRDCNFCHGEGNGNFEELKIDNKLKESLTLLKNKFGINEIHYTGGEPTRHPFIVGLTKHLTDRGFSVKTTSNGVVDIKKIGQLFDNGLKSINISIHSLNLDGFLKNQKSNNKDWGKVMLRKQQQTIEYLLMNNLNMKINTVITGKEDIDNAKKIYSYCKEKNIPLRILDNLTQKESAKEAIDSLIKDINGCFIKEEKEKGTSSIKKYYKDTEGYVFVVKEINKFTIPSICKDCNKDDCTEFFYGIRLEEIKGEGMKVMLCIDNLSKNTYMNIKDFIESQQAKDILSCFN